MKKELSKEEKVNRRLSVITVSLGIIALLFVTLCVLVTLYPQYQHAYVTSYYTSPTTGNTSISSYAGDEILSNFTLEGGKKEYLACRHIFSYEKEYHYEYALTPKEDSYFLIDNFSITFSKDEDSYSITFTPNEEYLLVAASELVLSKDIDLSTYSYSVSSTSLIYGYKVA